MVPRVVGSSPIIRPILKLLNIISACLRWGEKHALSDEGVEWEPHHPPHPSLAKDASRSFSVDWHLCMKYMFLLRSFGWLRHFFINTLEMYYVYIIKSISTPERIYIGFSADVKQRIKDHNAGKSKYTAHYCPWKVLWVGTFEEEQTARAFEKYLKTASGKAFMRKRLT